MDFKTKLFALAVIVLLIFLVGETALLLNLQPRNIEMKSIRVACVGDSITAGTEYPIDLWQLLGSDYIVSNFGIGGATVSLGTGSSWMNETGFEVAKRFQPEIVVVALGTNDANSNYNVTNADFVHDYSVLISEFQVLASKPKVYLVLPPPIFGNNANLSQTFFTQNVIPSIRQVANNTGLPLIDAHTPLVNSPEYFADGVHPNVQGAQKIADTVYVALISNKT
jgi:lysophospholipase L1-like esterase